MNSREVVLSAMRSQGKADALNLRNRAAELDGTGVIAEEEKVPVFDPAKDYSAWIAGAPVRELVEDEWQVFRLLQPHNAAHYPGSAPANAPALWSICHTKDAERAKPYLAPNGTSGLYALDEVCTKDGRVWRSIRDDNPYPPGETGTEDWWEAMGSASV